MLWKRFQLVVFFVLTVFWSNQPTLANFEKTWCTSRLHLLPKTYRWPKPGTERLNEAQTGDLIFLYQVFAIGDLIAETSEHNHHVNGMRVNHMGIVVRGAEGELSMLEEVPDERKGGLVLTPIDSVIARENKSRTGAGKLYFVPLRKRYRKIGERAVSTLLPLVGQLPYDKLFSGVNGEYCSSIVQKYYLRKKNSKPLFHTQPRYFGEIGSPLYLKWMKYFEALGSKIPSFGEASDPLGILIQGLENNFFKVD